MSPATYWRNVMGIVFDSQCAKYEKCHLKNKNDIKNKQLLSEIQKKLCTERKSTTFLIR